MFDYSYKKEEAIKLRKDGHSYSEILKEIDVAKSTLSLWLRDIGLARRQIQRLTKKKLESSKKGGLIKKNQKVLRVKEIYDKSYSEIDILSKRDLWLVGISLYWAEGSKEKDYSPGSGIQFGNSDPKMIKVFIKWLLDVCDISRNRVIFDIYIHEKSKNTLKEVREYWAKQTGFSVENFNRIYFKKHKVKTNRKSDKDLYFGLLRVKVKSSSDLVRRIAGWTGGIVDGI